MQKGSVVVSLVILVLILSGILVFVAWLPTPQTPDKTTPLPIPTQTPVVQKTPEPSPITDTSSLDAVTKSIDSTDLNEIDKELDKLNSETSF